MATPAAPCWRPIPPSEAPQRPPRAAAAAAGGWPLPCGCADAPPNWPAPVPLQPWELFQAKMAKAGLSQAAQDAFKRNYEQLVAGVTGLVRAPRVAGGG